jgi:pimeloyl-ACP methyl ester carboxylesterase
MATANIDGLSVEYEVIGDAGRTWVITPGGRFSMETAGVRELATALASGGDRVAIWDRPNTGASDVSFGGASESAMQADVLAGLLRLLDLAPAVIIGGSGGARVSLLTAARHPDTASGLAMWWISGGVYGLMTLGTHYCQGSIQAAWHGGMEAVVELPEWAEVLARNPSNRQRFLDQDPKQFIATMERWMAAYCPSSAELVPDLAREAAMELDVPTLVFRSGTADLHHRRETSEEVASALPNAQIVEPPWGDDEWNERTSAVQTGQGRGLFERWPLLAPQLAEWAAKL